MLTGQLEFRKVKTHGGMGRGSAIRQGILEQAKLQINRLPWGRWLTLSEPPCNVGAVAAPTSQTCGK